MRLRALVRKEVLLLLRDPHALAVLFIMPTLFLLLMAGAMSSYMQDKPPALRLIIQAPQDDASQFFRSEEHTFNSTPLFRSYHANPVSAADGRGHVQLHAGQTAGTAPDYPSAAGRRQPVLQIGRAHL